METIDEIFNCLIKGMGMLEVELKKNLTDKLTDESRLTYMKTMKILVFLIVEFANFNERKMVKASQDDFLSTTITNKVPLTSTSSDSRQHVQFTTFIEEKHQTQEAVSGRRRNIRFRLESLKRKVLGNTCQSAPTEHPEAVDSATCRRALC